MKSPPLGILEWYEVQFLIIVVKSIINISLYIVSMKLKFFVMIII